MKNANSHDKPSPADTPTERPNDNGHKSIVDNKGYDADDLYDRKIKKHNERGEQPVQPIKKGPK